LSNRLGRPRKKRPQLGASDAELHGASQRDLEAATGIPRHRIARAMLLASLPKDVFEREIAKQRVQSPQQLVLLARQRAGKSTRYQRRCPHCGGTLRTEGST